MFILEKPYISDFMVESITKNGWEVLDNEQAKELNLKTIDSKSAQELYSKTECPLIYSNSENSINWVLENLPESKLSDYIKLFKDKIAFRKMLKSVYPDFYFQEADFNELDNLLVDSLKFPLVLKPSVGFLSFGVHTIYNKEDWFETLKVLKQEMKVAQSLYPNAVVNSSKFILEEYIEGDEYAVDAYYNSDGEPVILNIFKHPFFDSKDVSDRIYIMSAQIIKKYLDKFTDLFKLMGKANNICNFPIHIEVRITKDERVIPIEVNPMRFAGWCTTDVSRYAWGINVYECFMNQIKLDWDSILSKSSDRFFYFSMAEVPSGIERGKIKSFNYDKYLANFSEILELRKIDYTCNPLFAVIFGSTSNEEEIKHILSLKTIDYLTLS